MQHVFIVGFAHSGTSLLLAMLGAHSQLYALKNETSVFVRHAHEKQQITAYFDAFYMEAEHFGKTAIVEKTPTHMEYIALIEEVYPDAKIIFMLRNSLDIIASYKHRYQDVYRAVRRYAEQTISFSNNYSAGKHFLVRYETLVESPNVTLQALCSWLDIPYEKSMLAYHTNTDNWFGSTELKETSGIMDEHNDYRNWQMHQPLFNDTNSYMQRLNPKEQICLKTESKTLISVLDSITAYNTPPQAEMLRAVRQAQYLLEHGFFPEKWHNAYPLFSLTDARPSLIAAHKCSAVFDQSGFSLRYDGRDKAYILLGGGLWNPRKTLPGAWFNALPLSYVRFASGGFACIPEAVYSFACKAVFFNGFRLRFTYLAYDACGALIEHKDLIELTTKDRKRKMYFRLPPEAAACNIAAYCNSNHPQFHVLCESLELVAYHEAPVPASLHIQHGQTECLFTSDAPFAVTPSRKVEHKWECSPGAAYSAQLTLANIAPDCMLTVYVKVRDAQGEQLGAWNTMQLDASCMSTGCRIVNPPEANHASLFFALRGATPADTASCTVAHFSLYRHIL